MKKLLLTSVAALFPSTGAAHAVEEPFSPLNPKGTAKVNHANDWICHLDVKMLGDQKLDTHGVCKDKNGEITLDASGDLEFGSKEGKCTKDDHIIGVKRTDHNAYIIYGRCDFKPHNLLIQLLGDTLLITNTENY